VVNSVFQHFLDRLRPGRPVAVLCHSDADGLAAGAILTRTLRQLGHAVAADVTRKGENAWMPSVAERLAAHEPQALIAADVGSAAAPILAGVPTLLIDHHQPEGVPPDAELITGYGLDPTPTSGLLAYECAAAVIDVGDLDWIAAVSILSDLGDTADFPLLAAAKKRYKLAPLREATTLLNAPRRAAAGDARPALELLLKSDGPKEVTHGSAPEVEVLKAARREFNAAYGEAKRAAPKFAGDVALIRTHSPCQVHPLVAQIWRTRLPKFIVVSANTGYLPGRVSFSVRSARGDNLLDFLRRHAPPDAGPEYGHGHDQATGGVLPFAAWNAFVTGLGFGPEAKVVK
jgi:single-stranded-DNA-specific exonuclease